MQKGKEKFYETVRQLRVVVSDPKHRECPCPKTACEWHGKCAECVAIHRYSQDHVPNCLQQFVNERIRAIAGIGELETAEKEKTPADYWAYVREQDGKAHGASG